MRQALLLPFALLAVVAAGCGAGGTESATAVDVAEAAEQTAGAGSARVSMTGTGAESFTGEGAFSGDSGRFTMSFPDSEDAPGSLEVIFAGGTMYMSVEGSGDFLGAGLPAGKKWLAVDLDAAEQADLGDFAALYSGDPTRILEELEASSDFEEVGREEVRSVETTRYRGTVEDGPIDVWIDDNGLLRRFQFTDEPTASETSTVTVELFDFGADVDVEPPPDDEVMRMSELFSGGS
jgi:outer membrane lipoprotein-sorting protein